MLCLQAVSAAAACASLACGMQTDSREKRRKADVLTGVRLLNERPRTYITDDGKTTSSLPTKRDVPVELRHKRTPAEFERFITKIRAESAAATAVEGA